jgi:hypothetical protein
MLSKIQGHVCFVCVVDIRVYCSVFCSCLGYIHIITYYCSCVLLICILPITRNKTVGNHEHSWNNFNTALTGLSRNWLSNILSAAEGTSRFLQSTMHPCTLFHTCPSQYSPHPLLHLSSTSPLEVFQIKLKEFSSPPTSTVCPTHSSYFNLSA